MFYERYLILCRNSRISPSGAATQAGFNRGTVSVWKKKYERGIDVRPEPDVIDKICRFFNCSETWLLGIDAEEKENPTTFAGDGEDEITREILSEIQSMTTEEKQTFLDFVRMFKARKGG